MRQLSINHQNVWIQLASFACGCVAKGPKGLCNLLRNSCLRSSFHLYCLVCEMYLTFSHNVIFVEIMGRFEGSPPDSPKKKVITDNGLLADLECTASLKRIIVSVKMYAKKKGKKRGKMDNRVPSD